MSIQLCNLINLPSNLSYFLIYQASRDGFGSKDFHSKADYVPSTLTIIKTNKGYIFGGYKTQKWEFVYPGYVNDDHAFIFSLKNTKNKPIKMKVINSDAINTDPDFGPTFSRIFISDQANITTSSNYVTENYELPNFVSNSLFLTDSSMFLVSEIEVYQLNRN